MRSAAAILAFLLLAPPSFAAGADCERSDDYGNALCSYRSGDLAAARQRFRAIADANQQQPETIKSLYFLARTEMKLKRWDEASAVLSRIYLLSPPFYKEWNCDFLLGVCRKALGKD